MSQQAQPPTWWSCRSYMSDDCSSAVGHVTVRSDARSSDKLYNPILHRWLQPRYCRHSQQATDQDQETDQLNSKEHLYQSILMFQYIFFSMHIMSRWARKTRAPTLQVMGTITLASIVNHLLALTLPTTKKVKTSYTHANSQKDRCTYPPLARVYYYEVWWYSRFTGNICLAKLANRYIII